MQLLRTYMTRILSAFLLFVGFSFLGNAQFYTGSQLEFGKNRMQYNGAFDWKIQNFARFQVYYYPGEESLVEYTAKSFQKELEQIEREFDVHIDNPMEVIVFKSLTDLRQSNIGTGREEENNVGQQSMVSGSRLMLYYETTHEQLDIQIRKVLAEYLLNNILYGERWTDLLVANPLSNHPTWFIYGFASYYSQPWSAQMDAELKDAFLTGRLDNFSRLNDRDALLAGHAFWNYIYQMYGNNKLFQIIRMTQATQHVDRSLLYEVGMTSKDLLPEFGNYYKKIYLNDLTYQQDIPYTKIQIPVKKNHIYKQFSASPDGQHFALVDYSGGKYTVWLYGPDMKRTKIFKGGVRLSRIQDYSNPVLDWNPKGKILSFFHETKGELLLSMYDIEDKELNTKKMPQLDKVQDFSYAKSGAKMVLSGVKNGQSDIYVLTIAGNTLEKITDDFWDDLDPQFVPDESGIVFSSNRSSDTLSKIEEIQPMQENYDIFKYDFKKNRSRSKHAIKVFDRITATPTENEWKPNIVAPQTYTYLSDRSGTLNLYQSKEDSSILFVDTITHYRYFTGSKPLTNFSTTILDYQTSAAKNKHYFQVFQNGIFKFYSMPAQVENIPDLSQTFFRKKYLQLKELQLSRKQFSDSLNQLDSLAKRQDYRKPDEKAYQVNFSKDLVLMQVSNGFLNSAYQRYSPGSEYFNSTLNILFRSAFSDIFEDFRIRGAIRVPTNFNAGEFLGTIDFNRRRFDHQVSLFRQGYVSENSETGDLTKWIIHEARYRISFPFSEVLSLRNSFSYRNDKQLFLATDKVSLEAPNRHYHQAGFKSELVWDNAFYSELNTWKGWKGKVFGELGVLPGPDTKVLLNIGFDLRNAQSFYKNITWVNRLAGSTSSGSAPIIYYLGGVDNWAIRPDVSFDQNKPVDPSKNYFFQTIATPLRGVIQNTRNGNSFFVFNSELRIPVFKVLSNHPVKNEVLRTFQWIFFADAGCAWTGLTPYSKDNHFNTLIIENKPIEIQLVNSREPVVGGIGTGVRGKIFGYFIRVDMGWGIENLQINKKPVTYFSIGYDI